MAGAKHSNISIFVPHVGCPHRCAFCDQRTISGEQKLPKAQDVRDICREALDRVPNRGDTEIAFFGGSFTAIPRDYMVSLLEAAAEFVGEGRFRGIRCSTRPDCIDREILELLKSYGVTAVELGAQSMSDRVLEANERGHTAGDVEQAAELIKSHGLELGLQMMIGLYQSTPEDERETFRRLSGLSPDTMRLYPTVILRGTRLGEMFLSGEYQPFSFDTVLELCTDFLEQAEGMGIRIIKCGLHASELVESDMVGGFYHPAFRELCEGLIYRRRFEREIANRGGTPTGAEFAVPAGRISAAVGQKRANVRYFGQKGITLRIVPDPELRDKYRVISIN